MLFPVSRSALRAPARLSTGLAVASALALAFTVGGSRASAQTGPTDFYPGKNVDTTGPTKPGPIFSSVPDEYGNWNPRFIGNPDGKQFNEPSCDSPPDNPLVVCCGGNDYRAVDRPPVSDPWVGMTCSTDGGDTWKSFLHPGFKGDVLHTPLALDTAADALFRAAPGIALYNFIAFNRTSAGTGDNSGLYISRWYPRTKEDGFPYQWLETRRIVGGTPPEGGSFVDKPVMEISLRNCGAFPCFYSYSVPDPANPGSTRTQRAPQGTVHLAYAVFIETGTGKLTQIRYQRSTNYGESFSAPIVLSESSTVNQAVALAINGDRVVAIWRRFSLGTGVTDAIMTAVSTNGGQSWSKAKVLRDIAPFDQGTSTASIRITTHPFITFDGTAFRAFWSARGFALNNNDPVDGWARIVVSRSTDGSSWTDPVTVEDDIALAGHQFHPGVVTVGPRTLLAWFDTRDDNKIAQPPPIDTTINPNKYILDYLYTSADTRTRVRQRKADLRSAQAVGGSSVFGPSKQISRYQFGVFPGQGLTQLEFNELGRRMFKKGTLPFHGDYIGLAGVRFAAPDPVNNPGVWRSSAGRADVQPLFHVAWTDNRKVRGDTSAGLAGTTIYTPPPTLAPLDSDDDEGLQKVRLDAEEDKADESQPRLTLTACKANADPDSGTVATTGTRAQAVFAARVSPDLFLLPASAPKETGTVQQRAYALLARNAGDTPKTVTLTIANQPRWTAWWLTFFGWWQPPTAGTASFDRATQVTSLTTTIPPRSGIARTVYLTTQLKRPPIKITATVNTTLVATAYLNPNPDAPPVENPIAQPEPLPGGTTDIGTVELHDPTILYRATAAGEQQVASPAIDDPAIDDPAIDDPAIDDPAIDDPAIDDPAIDDPAIDDPAIDDPAIDDPAIDDKSYENPAIDDPAIDDAAISATSLLDPDTSTGVDQTGASVQQVTWKLGLDGGNTTTAMTTQVVVNAPQELLNQLNGKTQLIVSRRYVVDKVVDCEPRRISEFQVLANITNPLLVSSQCGKDETPEQCQARLQPDLVNPPPGQPSFIIPPGGAVYLTLIARNAPEFRPNTAGVVVQSQPANTVTAIPPGDEDIPTDVTAPALNLPKNGAAGFAYSAEATGPSGAAVIYTASASDETDGTVVVDCTPGSGTLFAITTTPVGCTATDTAGNIATGGFNVVVADTTAPAVTVPDAITIEATGASGAAVEFAASATDLVAGTITPTCTTAPVVTLSGGPAFVGTFRVGTTLVQCSASDTAKPTPNTSSGSFSVTVRDTTAPQLVLLGDNPLTQEAATLFVDPGATASDTVKGDLSSDITVAGSVDTAVTGSYTLTYTVSDGFNTTTATRAVKVVDTTPPMLTLTGANPLTQEAATLFVDPGATASDTAKGPLTSAIAVSGSVNTEVVGSYTLTYTVSDGFNTTTATRTVNVVDTTPPQLMLLGNNPLTQQGATPFTDPGATASDTLKGDLTSTLTVSGNVDTAVVGSYTLTYTVSDGFNTTTATRTVNVVDTIAPILTLNGLNPLTQEAATPFVDPGATASDSLKGILTTAISVSGSVNTAVVGSYTLTYTVSDGFNTTTATRTVNVADTIAPGLVVKDISANAPSNANAAVVTFTPTVEDAVDAAPTVVCTPASGSSFTVGSTPVSCTATDDATNATTNTFTVTVRDVTPPVVTVPVNIVAEATSGAGAVVTYTTATATDVVSGSRPASCSPASGTVFPLATATVTCSAIDAAGNPGSASFSITVRDTTAPVITGTPSNITAYGPSSGAVVTYTSPTATDLVSGNRPVTCLPVSGSTFAIDTKTVTCSATDVAGNTGTTSFTVTVTLDNIAPTISPVTATPKLLWPPNGSMVPVTLTGTATDAQSGIASITYSVVDEYNQVKPSGSCAVSGTAFTCTFSLLQDRKGNDKDGRKYTITVTARDKAGNSKNATPVVVNVHDQSS